MPAYGYVDEKIIGGLYGLDNHVEGGWVAKEEIEFGRPVFGYIGSEKHLYMYKKDVGKIVFDADFVTSNSIVITVNGVAAAAVPFNTDHNTTMDDVIAAVNALSGVKAVVDVDDVNNRTILIQVKGQTAVVAEAITGGASQATGTITYDTSMVFVGGAVRTQNSPGVYEVYDAVNVLVRGSFYGDASTAADAQNEAYAADSADGKFANSGNAINARFRETIAAAGLVRVEINGQTELGLAGLFASV